jgi:hypothetical protein
MKLCSVVGGRKNNTLVADTPDTVKCTVYGGLGHKFHKVEVLL